ncbi:hypothetical protein OTU49_007405 [Cherax quadricarinatus]|uniref:Uncharacterized protein n=1 Tax=Cherax quadricarinatus TaxID=27406 RepID=A0AAW0WLC8_CHEQU
MLTWPAALLTSSLKITFGAQATWGGSQGEVTGHIGEVGVPPSVVAGHGEARRAPVRGGGAEGGTSPVGWRGSPLLRQLGEPGHLISDMLVLTHAEWHMEELGEGGIKNADVTGN